MCISAQCKQYNNPHPLLKYKYNIEMIEDKQTIIALGADAVSKVVFLDENRIERFANIKDIKEYCNRIDEMIEGKINLLDSRYLKGEE